MCRKKYGKIAALVIDNKTLNIRGKVSHVIYLFHYTIPYFYNVLLMAHLYGRLNIICHIPIIAELLQLALLAATSYLSFYLIESRFLRLKNIPVQLNFNWISIPPGNFFPKKSCC